MKSRWVVVATPASSRTLVGGAAQVECLRVGQAFAVGDLLGQRLGVGVLRDMNRDRSAQHVVVVAALRAAAVPGLERLAGGVGDQPALPGVDAERGGSPCRPGCSPGEDFPARASETERTLPWMSRSRTVAYWPPGPLSATVRKIRPRVSRSRSLACPRRPPPCAAASVHLGRADWHSWRPVPGAGQDGVVLVGDRRAARGRTRWSGRCRSGCRPGSPG